MDTKESINKLNDLLEKNNENTLNISNQLDTIILELKTYQKSIEEVRKRFNEFQTKEEIIKYYDELNEIGIYDDEVETDDNSKEILDTFSDALKRLHKSYSGFNSESEKDLESKLEEIMKEDYNG